MAEESRPWDGTATGDAGPYGADSWADWMRRVAANQNDEGVVPEFPTGSNDNELRVTGIASPVTIQPGAAIVDGVAYRNTAALTLAMANPAANPRVDRVVLRKSWAAQTVRLALVTGAEAGAPVAPALTQTDGVTWELPIASMRITVAGVISLERDDREFLLAQHEENLMIGGSFESWSAGAAAAPDGFTLAGAGATVAQDAANVKIGTFSAAVTRAGADASLQRNLAVEMGGATYIQGRTYAIQGWVRASTAAVGAGCGFFINDGVSNQLSGTHPGDGQFHRIRKVVTLSPTATQFQFNTRHTVNGVVEYDGFQVVEARAPREYAPHPSDRHLRITNFQTNAPADNIDQGLWRKEIGTRNSSGAAGVAITFETAFRTIRSCELTCNNGGVAGIGTYSVLATTGFSLHGWDDTGARAVLAWSWEVIGQV